MTTTHLLGILFLVLIGLLWWLNRRAEKAEQIAQKEVEKGRIIAWDLHRKDRDRAIDAARGEYESKKNDYIRLTGDDDADDDGDGPKGNA